MRDCHIYIKKNVFLEGIVKNKTKQNKNNNNKKKKTHTKKTTTKNSKPQVARSQTIKEVELSLMSRRGIQRHNITEFRHR